MEKTEYSDVNITSVKLVNEGLKGIEVEYCKIEENSGRSSDTPKWEGPQFPIHSALEKNFTWLKGHLLSICGYDSKDENKLQATTVTSVRTESGWFIISGKLEVYENGKVISLTTPKTCNDEEYLNFDAVSKIITAIYEETKVYLAKGAIMNDIEIVLKSKKSDDKFDKDTFLLMSEEEQRAFATSILEKGGSIIIHREEIEDINSVMLQEEGDKNEKEMFGEETVISVEPVEEVKGEEKFPAEILAGETIVEEPFVEEIKETSEMVFDLEEETPADAGDEMNISFTVTPVAEPKKSTAKLKSN